MIVLILFLVLGLIITIVGMIENESWPFITGLVITFSSLLGMLYGCGQASVTYEIINPSRIERIEKNVYCTFYDSTLKIAASDSAPIFDLEDEKIVVQKKTVVANSKSIANNITYVVTHIREAKGEPKDSTKVESK